MHTLIFKVGRWTSDNRPFAQLLAWVRDGASGDGRSVTCTWIAPRTARNGDKKSTSRPSETLKLHEGDWPTVNGCPVSNPGNNCANGLLAGQPGSKSGYEFDGTFLRPCERLYGSLEVFLTTMTVCTKSFGERVCACQFALDNDMHMIGRQDFWISTFRSGRASSGRFIRKLLSSWRSSPWSETLKFNTPVYQAYQPIMSLFNQFSTRSVIIRDSTVCIAYQNIAGF